MTSDDQARRAMERQSERMAQILTQLAAEAKTRRATGFVLPIVDSDPTEGATNLFGFADGQMNFRTPDGVVHRFKPYTGAPVPIPTFATPPAFSTGHRIWWNGTTGDLQGYLNDGTLRTVAATSTATSTSGGESQPPPTTSTVPKPADPTPQRYTKTYGANWARTFCSRHGVESGGDLYYGYYPGAHGERRIMFGFPDGTMRSDLAGGTIKKVELRGRNVYSWGNAGITIRFGGHTKDTAPGSFSQNRKDLYVGGWPRSGWGGGADRWRTVSNSIGNWFKSGYIKGLTIDNPSTVTSYGRFDWSSLDIRITYVR